MQNTRTMSRFAAPHLGYLGVGFAVISAMMLVAAQAAETPITGTGDSPNLKVAITQENANTQAKTDCVACHQFEPTQTHPLDVVPTMAIGGALPLSQGKLTCLTCHDAGSAHETTREKVGVRGGNPTGLCVECHSGASTGTEAVHSLVYGKAHVTSGNIGLIQGKIDGLDQESKDCMSCHDGTAASVAGGHSIQQGFDGPADHPVGVPMKVTERTKGGDFNLASASSLDRRIRLTQGNIACATCHSMYSREPAKLVMSNQGSKLCLNCHTN